MAVAAYTSLVSLTHVLDNLRYRAPFHLPHLGMEQIDTIEENVYFLLEIVDRYSERESPEIRGLWRQIAEVATEVEEMINFHVVHQLYLTSQGETSDADLSTFYDQDMEKVISRIDFIKQELLLVMKPEGEGVLPMGKQPRAFLPAGGSSANSSNGKSVVVGIDEHVVRIMDELTKDESNLQILPIVGMGGIGKTTLARNVFDHRYIVNCFDRRIWLTISQEYTTEEILKGLLMGGNSETSEGSAELGERLYKNLFGRKYLIVMDDVWTYKAWGELKMFFPNNKNGSRVLLTTRLSDMAASLGSHNPYPLTFLDENKSWDLFCQITFGQQGCPYAELEEIGKDIVRSCRGLPSEIAVIGSLLANSNMTWEYWALVAENINSFGNLGDDEHCFKTLSLSYRTLPIHLKSCFLQLRVFPEDAKIEVSSLIRLWVEEGLVKAGKDKSLEEVAEENLKGLVGRNLIFVRDWSIMGKMLKCGVHDLLRDMCLSESSRERFICSRLRQDILSRDGVNPCILCGGSTETFLSELILISPSALQVNPLVCEPCKGMHSEEILARASGGVDCVSARKHTQPSKLRCLEVKLGSDLKVVSPLALHLLWNLHTIIISLSWRNGPLSLPSEIWEMPQLRLLDVNPGMLPDPDITHAEGKESICLKNLHTLSFMRNFSFTEEIIARIPNLRSLEIIYGKTEGIISPSSYSLCYLAGLHKLESLVLYNAWENIAFPNSLKRLVFYFCLIPFEEMTVIGSLPNLEEVEFWDAPKGHEWNPLEGEFLQLKSLRILGSPDLVCWRADNAHFPKLECLYLSGLVSLEEIPSGIGDIATLHTIVIANCSDSAVTSAKEIWEEQQSMGNESLKIFVMDRDGKEYQVGAIEEQTIEQDEFDS